MRGECIEDNMHKFILRDSIFQLSIMSRKINMYYYYKYKLQRDDALNLEMGKSKIYESCVIRACMYDDNGYDDKYDYN